MKLRDLFANIEKKRPGAAVSETALIEELNRFEAMVFAEIYDLYEGGPESIGGYDETQTEAELHIAPPWDDVYLFLLLGKIDFSLGEVEDYNNDIAMLNAQMDSYRAYWARTHLPKQRYSIDPFGKRRASCVTPI